jgi:hypothetical protein
LEAWIVAQECIIALARERMIPDHAALRPQRRRPRTQKDASHFASSLQAMLDLMSVNPLIETTVGSHHLLVNLSVALQKRDVVRHFDASVSPTSSTSLLLLRIKPARLIHIRPSSHNNPFLDQSWAAQWAFTAYQSSTLLLCSTTEAFLLLGPWRLLLWLPAVPRSPLSHRSHP